MARYVAAVAMVWVAACARPSEVDFKGSGAFGTVPVGESRSIAVSLANDGDEAAEVVLATEGDFSVEPSTVRIDRHSAALLTVTFTPREVGTREGRLVASFRDRQRALLLSGTGTGPRLQAADRVQFARSVIYTGVPPTPTRAFTWLQNRGTEGSTLTFGQLVIDGPAGLCVGDLVEDACQAWTPGPLEAGESVRLPLAFWPSAPGDARWIVTFTTNDPVEPERRIEVLATTEGRDPGCLTISPSTLDFGTVRLTCTSATQTFTISNICSSSLVLSAPRIAGSTEFVVMNGWRTGAQLEPGSLTVEVAYRPTNYGADTGALVLSEVGSVEHVVSLQGRGDMRPDQTDVFRDEPIALVDLLIMVDPSPSFVSRRADVRSNLARVVQGLASASCNTDLRIAVAAADGDPSANVTLLSTDAGQRWTSSNDPAVVDRVLSAYDSLPIGSETEACIGPAADLISDAGLRGRFAGLCITDALEQTPAPTAALQRIRNLTDGGTYSLSWDVVAGLEPSCGVEAVDDGVHASLITHGNSVVDVCNPTWSDAFRSGCGGFPTRTEYPLSARPEGAIEVRLNGVLLSPVEWSYDPTNNSIRIFVPPVPEQVRQIEVSYRSACVP